LKQGEQNPNPNTQLRRRANAVRGLAAMLALLLCTGSAFGWNYLTPMTNLVVCPGDGACFSSVASGPLPYRFQWWKNGVLIPGQTNDILTLSNVTSADAATYSLKLTGGYDSVTNSATLTVRTNVTATPLSNLAKCPGSSAVFSTIASGTGPFGYEWEKNGALIPGATTNSLILTNVTAASAGTYSVIVSGACDRITNCATLTINQSVAVACGPSSVTNCPGGLAVFSVSATGTGLRYQWFEGTNILAGQTNSSLTLSNITSANAGNYRVAISDACGDVLTNTASLTVNQPLVLVSGPASQTNCPGGPAMFSVSATGTGLSYQWFKGSTLLVGQTNDVLSLSNISETNAGTYSVVVSGACGNVLTNSATLTVNQPLVLVSGPASQTNCPGGPATFSVNATGTGLTYQWFKDNTLLAGQTNSLLSLSNISETNAGTYSVVVSGACGNVLTNSATLTVNQPLVLASGPASQTNCPGGPATFSVNATGTGLTYQWFKDNTLLAGQTNSLLSLSNISEANAGTYSVVVSGACGNVLTNSATLTVNQPVQLIAGPTNLTNCLGTVATFSVNATGTGLSYQWFEGTNDLSGQTNASLIFTNVVATNAGVYSVVVTDACGGTLTNSASLTVLPLPSIACASNKTVELGSVWAFDAPVATVDGSTNVIVTIVSTGTNTVGHCGNTFDATRTWEVIDSCGNSAQCSQTVFVVDTTAPTVSILLPTNGAVFLAPANFTIVADAQDIGGAISRVHFFAGSSSLGITAFGPPHSVVVSNLGAGAYTLLATATDACGNMGTSAPVHITVLANVPLSVNGPIRLNFQSGFYQQTATISNPTQFALNAVGVMVYNLPPYWRVQNASFVTNGVPCILYNQPLASGASASVSISYFLGAGASTNAAPTLVAVAMSPTGGTTVSGTPVAITREMFLNDGSFLINFNTSSNRTYFVQYSADLRTWNTCPYPVYGSGYSVQWIDNGPPSTASMPDKGTPRYYRVVLVP